MSLRGKAERARAIETVAIQQGAGMLDVYRVGIEERYLHEIQASVGGARDHTFGSLTRPLTPYPPMSLAYVLTSLSTAR
jgi:hypothetical protein